MKNATIIATILSLSLSLFASPFIDSTSVTMRQEANRKVIVSYTVENEPAIVTVDFEQKTDEGEWVSLGDKVRSVVGDVNRKVDVGPHELIWIARKDWPNQQIADARLRAVVTAWATNCPPDYMVINLETAAQTFYPRVEALPYGLSNVIYRTSHLVMRKIPAAGVTWLMGRSGADSVETTLETWSSPANETPHFVSFSSDYYMAVYEMTQGQNVRLVNSTCSRDTHPEKPVDGMSYVSLRGKAAEGIDWPKTGSTVGGHLATMRAKTGVAFDMPTEAQWEYACRAGTQTSFYMGGNVTTTGGNCGVADLDDYTWYKGNLTATAEMDGGAYKGGLQIVGQKKPNAWGLYDMMGNASE